RMMCGNLFFFFFSSRRRHTRSYGDWSSDVCSSDLCRMIGTEPYLAGNVGSGTPQEMRNWIEYCNIPSGSTLAEERIKNGATEPRSEERRVGKECRVRRWR